MHWQLNMLLTFPALVLKYRYSRLRMRFDFTNELEDQVGRSFGPFVDSLGRAARRRLISIIISHILNIRSFPTVAFNFLKSGDSSTSIALIPSPDLILRSSEIICRTTANTEFVEENLKCF